MKHMKRIGLSLLFFCGLHISAITHAQQFELDSVTEKLDYLIGQEITWQGLTPSYTIYVDKGGKTVYEKSVGLADIEGRVMATSDTVYQIGSISKSYVALAILQLVEQGKVKLQSTVTDYVKDYDGPGGVATVEQLLVHTSGIPNYTALPEGREILAWVPTEREDIRALFESLPLDFEPGSNYSYSNSGYYLLGLIVEEVSGQDYYDYLEEHIYEPLGLTATYSGNYEEIVPNRARGYSGAQGEFTNAPPTPNLTPFSAGSIQASARDVALYRRGVFQSGVFSKRLLKMLTSTVDFASGTNNPYALGALSHGQLGEHTSVSHSGGISGFISHHVYYPNSDLTVVVLTNTGTPPVSPAILAEKVAAVVLGVSQDSAADTQPVEVDETTLERYAGEYLMTPFRITGDGRIALLVKDGQLHVTLGDGRMMPPTPLTPISQREFVMPGLSNSVISMTESRGKVTGLVISGMTSSDMPAKRVN